MKLSACITTRNRTSELENCLTALWQSTVLPFSVIVSDDSVEESVQNANREVVDRYPGTTYILGPQNGVCGNRNNAVNAVQGADLVAFVDDDINVEPDFIQIAIEHYEALSIEQRELSIVSGVSVDQYGQFMKPAHLSFRGYFTPNDTPSDRIETVAIHATIFPRSFFYVESWDENIYFGYEDGELCLRALKRGYKIISCSKLKVFNACYNQGVLGSPENTLDNELENNSGRKQLSNYEIYTEAARLYVGIKRYKDISPNLIYLVSFLLIYFLHILFYLGRRQSISSLVEIIRRSNYKSLFSVNTMSSGITA
jgi:glycosyltransferase involved in cell wall biosynthesis